LRAGRRGTTFHVALPAADELIEPSRILEPPPRARGPIIVAIDDDREALEVLQDQLSAGKFRVYGASSPNTGLRLAHDLQPALITLDVKMPDIDGWQVLAALRRDPVTATIPILVVSATDEDAEARAKGANGFVRKPAQPNDLLAQVSRLLTETQPALAEGTAS
jgi:CheY-like chemotaxis protein